MTQLGGNGGFGNIFQVGVDGSGYQDLFDFTNPSDGGEPTGDLTLSGGTLFGMATNFGANGFGTVFALPLPSPTPEPATLALLGAAAAIALVSFRMRRVRRGRE
jgi:uncharacterized repeat protein (TIGR03803 family)